jgi:hypothetical protein
MSHPKRPRDPNQLAKTIRVITVIRKRPNITNAKTADVPISA